MLGNWKLSLAAVVAVVSAVILAASHLGALPPSGHRDSLDRAVGARARGEIREGRRTFRFETFGDEAL